jgi:hypothetical protein
MSGASRLPVDGAEAVDEAAGAGVGSLGGQTSLGGTDLKIVIYTAVPGSEDEAKLQLTRVAGVV